MPLAVGPLAAGASALRRMNIRPYTLHVRLALRLPVTSFARYRWVHAHPAADDLVGAPAPHLHNPLQIGHDLYPGLDPGAPVLYGHAEHGPRGGLLPYRDPDFVVIVLADAISIPGRHVVAGLQRPLVVLG